MKNSGRIHVLPALRLTPHSGEVPLVMVMRNLTLVLQQVHAELGCGLAVKGYDVVLGKGVKHRREATQRRKACGGDSAV
ncbi:hypothetical protein PR202_ga15292 [Eleusine coracana subsp. coracana]|uniref:Uncharacterized protein n=1 Tax=Eleusine coracana subsp. coracana TaxID=191504 RepID=A0AAV5CJU8_ELECO|nr:hypothetical protein PR202_ga15292 [Eleusine coracana subsp. coracana]